jgi:hypothetical protein
VLKLPGGTARQRPPPAAAGPVPSSAQQAAAPLPTPPAPQLEEWSDYVETAYCASDRWALFIATVNL